MNSCLVIAEQQLSECGRVSIRPDQNDETAAMYAARQFAGCINAERLNDAEIKRLVAWAYTQYTVATSGRPVVTAKVFQGEVRRQVEENRDAGIRQRAELAEIQSLRILREQQKETVDANA